MGKDICVHQTPGLGSLAPSTMLDKSEPQFPHLKDGNEQSLPSPFCRSAIIQYFRDGGRTQRMCPSAISAKALSETQPNHPYLQGKPAGNGEGDQQQQEAQETDETVADAGRPGLRCI